MESQEDDSSVVEAAISGPDEIVKLNSSETSPTLLPENWEVILRDLPSRDFLSAINSNPQWNQLMNSKKPAKLFPLVFPMLIDYLPLKDTLELRLANKSVLKEAVDTQLQKLSACPISEFGYIPSWKENVNNPQTKVEVIRNKFEFEKQEQLQSFLQLTESIFSCGGNPFLSGNLSIQLGLNGVDDGDDGQALSLMLTRFGVYLSSVSITDLDYYTAPEDCVLRLIYILSNLPNLKLLQLGGTLMGNREMEFFTSETLPSAPFLVSLDLSALIVEDVPSGEPVPIILPLLQRYGHSLQVLKINGRMLGASNIGVEVLNNLLPNVKCVQLSDIHVCPAALLKLTSVNCKLEQLRVSGSPDSGMERYCRLLDIVQVGIRHGETLQTLELFVTLSSDQTRNEEWLGLKQMERLYPKLSKLSTNLENTRDLSCWKFVEVSCANLEELHLRVHIHDRLLAMDEINLQGAFLSLRKLNKIVVRFNEKPKIVIRNPTKKSLLN